MKSKNRAIGGFFGLELRKGEEFHKDALKLNTGRNAFEYIIIAKEYSKAYIPYYTCESILEPLKKHTIQYEFYGIDNDFYPIFDFNRVKRDECFLYTDYFGINKRKVKGIIKMCPNLIVDNSQAFFAKPFPGIDTFYSPRKYFGVPDGAYLYTDKKLDTTLEKDRSFTRFRHL